MEKHILIASVLLISALTATAQENLTENQKAVQQTVVKVFDALSNRDSLSLKEYCAKDILLFEYGQVWNLDTLIRKAIKRNKANDFKRVNNLEFIYTTVDRNTAWAAYNLHSEMTREGKQSTVHWLETVVLVREKKKWRLKTLHSTMIKRS
ncbi:MAG: nuclear transport factor 2 family protein [Cyclobacteriaceae bacterium]